MAGFIGKTVRCANLRKRETTPEMTPRQKVPGFWENVPGFGKKAPGFWKKAPGYDSLGTEKEASRLT
jgi:hypothetical protein